MMRAAASWQAFKEGKALFDGGAVVEAQAGESAWRGVVRVGQRLVRVRVEVKSATHLETHCSCPENRASGALCGHAVAAGLAALAGASGTPARGSAEQAPTSPGALAWRIRLPPNWRDALSRQQLAATLEHASGHDLAPADERLQAWLGRERVAAQAIVHLALAGKQVAAFLEAIADHPRVATGKDRLALDVRTGERLRLAAITRDNDQIRMVADEPPGRWSEVGGSFWRPAAGSLTRLGEGSLPAGLAAGLLEIAHGRTVQMPIRRFLEHLELWQQWILLPPDSWLDALHFTPATATFELTLAGSLEQVRACLWVQYPDCQAVPPGCGKVDGLPRLSGQTCEIRDTTAEQRALAQLAHAGFLATPDPNHPWCLRGESAIVNFLTRTLPHLKNHWTITPDSQFARLQQQVLLVSPTITVHHANEDGLSFDLTFQANDGSLVSAAEVRRLLRSGKPSNKVAGGKHLVVSDDVANLIEPLFADLDLHQEQGRYVASARSAELIMEISNKLSNKHITNDLEMNDSAVKPATLRAEMRPYQVRGTAWLVDRVERFGGALLADDMGLGKTLQAIAAIECFFTLPASDSGVVLVVATASLVGNWRAEFGRFAPGRRVRVLHGAGRDAERERVEAGDVVLTSFGTLTRDLAWHLRCDYRAVVVDEASLLRNPDTDDARAVAKLRTARRIALTGTPVENGVRDLWSIFRFIQPGWLGGRESFRERYELPLADGLVAGAVMERLKLKIQPFWLRRTKEQVAPELPAKLFIDEFCDLSPDQLAVYREVLHEGRKQVDASRDSGQQGAARMQLLTALLRLRQTCCDLALFHNDRWDALPLARRSAKLQRLLELLDEAQSGNHKVLVFSQFQKQLLEIEKCIGDRGWRCLRLDGATRDRQRLVESFQDPGGPPVFLISLKAGGYGLNLTAADTVIHFDPWWNPAAEMQATDRAHRIGQTRPVTVYRLLTRGTVEDKVVRLQGRKRQLAAAIDEGGGGDAAGWTVADLQAVLRDD